MTGYLRIPSGDVCTLEPSVLAQERGNSDRVVFGKRVQPPRREAPSGKERLEAIGVELNLLFAQRVEARNAFALLSEEKRGPILSVGRVAGLAAFVEFDEATAYFVLFERGAGDAVFMTMSERRLIDHIVSLATAAFAQSQAQIGESATSLPSGSSVASIDEQLVMSTLLKFQGNCRRAALALGIDDAALHARLQRYFQTRLRSSSRLEDRS